MTPADFDRPYVDEAAERFAEQAPAAREPEREKSSAAPEAPAEEKPSGERKRGWWKRVLS